MQYHVILAYAINGWSCASLSYHLTKHYSLARLVYTVYASFISNTAMFHFALFAVYKYIYMHLHIYSSIYKIACTATYILFHFENSPLYMCICTTNPLSKHIDTQLKSLFHFLD